MLADSYEPGSIYIQSTPLTRTMNSGYSELIGLYPPTLQTESVDSILGSASLPFNIRGIEEVEAKFVNSAVPSALE